MNPSYIITDKEKLKSLFEQTSPDIKALIKGGELKNVTTTLGQKYKIPIGNYVALSNVIASTLIGALDPSNVVIALKDLVELSEEDATKLASELETSIFEKARMITLGKSGEEVVKLEFKGERTKEELRKEIMDTTKRTSALAVPQNTPLTVIPKKTVITPGSRSQLLEQLQILGKIPNDDEIEERLAHITEQIGSIKKQEEENLLESNIALKSFMFGDKGKEAVDAKMHTATYSVAPTHYNLDPYREVAED